MSTRALFPETQDKAAQSKIDSSLIYSEKVRNSGKVCSLRLPIELGAYWIGSIQPPFEHGDKLQGLSFQSSFGYSFGD